MVEQEQQEQDSQIAAGEGAQIVAGLAEARLHIGFEGPCIEIKIELYFKWADLARGSFAKGRTETALLCCIFRSINTVRVFVKTAKSQQQP